MPNSDSEAHGDGDGDGGKGSVGGQPGIRRVITQGSVREGAAELTPCLKDRLAL